MKAALEVLLVRGGVAALARRRLHRARLVLAYHNIVPDGDAVTGDSSLHLPVAAFRRHLDRLTEHHEVVSLANLIEDHSATGRPRVAITFDDAYRGTVTSGVAELTRRSLPATIFVAPAFVGGGTFWWDALGPALTEAVRAEALETCGGQDDAVRRWAAARQIQLAVPPPHAAVASESELRAAVQSPGITLGSHSWSHPNLTRLAPADLAAELARPLAWLRQRFERVLPVIAYPYGLYSPAVTRAAAAAGYTAGLGITGGWLRGPADQFAWPRLNVPAGLSDWGFALRGAGLFCR